MSKTRCKEMNGENIIDVWILLGLNTTSALQTNTKWNETTPSEEDIYHNIRTGAETGWDFSSR